MDKGDKDHKQENWATDLLWGPFYANNGLQFILLVIGGYREVKQGNNMIVLAF